MTLEMVLQDNVAGVAYNLSEAVSNLRITTYLHDTPGKCEFDIVEKDKVSFGEGATVSVVLDGTKMFKGYVFRKRFTEEKEIIHVTAYDQLRYLKNKDFQVFEGMTCSDIFSKLCNDFALKSSVVDSSSHVCAPRNEDAVSLYDMLMHAFNDTLTNTREWFFVRDNFGTLEHRNVRSAVSSYVLGDESEVTGFAYDSSIESDVYNQIKLYRDNEETGKRDTFVVNDTINGGDNLKAWGILQLYEKVDEKYNESQIESRATAMLNYYNSPRRTLKISCLGIPEMFAGTTVQVKIANLGDTSINSYMLITECSHSIDNEYHTMELSMEVVRSV